MVRLSRQDEARKNTEHGSKDSFAVGVVLYALLLNALPQTTRGYHYATWPVQKHGICSIPYTACVLSANSSASLCENPGEASEVETAVNKRARPDQAAHGARSDLWQQAVAFGDVVACGTDGCCACVLPHVGRLEAATDFDGRCVATSLVIVQRPGWRG